MDFLRRLWFFARRRRLDRELRDEMRWHLEQRVAALVAEGFDEAAARAEARRAFGNVTHLREESRDAWGFVALESLAQDVRHGARALARSPLLTAVAVLSLGASMAACCAVFALAHATTLASLPVPDPDRLVVLGWIAGPEPPYESLDGWATGNDRESRSGAFSYDAFVAARARVKGRAEVFGFADLYQVNVAAEGRAEIATGQLVSGNYYEALGLRPIAGRFITAADDRPDAPVCAVVISYAAWQRRFGGRHDVIGAAIRVNEVPAVVVGVAPRGFRGTGQVGERADVSLPMALRDRVVHASGIGPGQAAEDSFGSRDPRYWWVSLMARLAPGTRRSDIGGEIERAVRPTLAGQNAEAARGQFRISAMPGARGLNEARSELVRPLLIMAAIVLLVVVIACANLATLLLARGVARDRETGVRYALGASRGRLVRSMMIESLLVGLMGGAVGLLGTRWLAYGLLPALWLDPAGLDIAIRGPILVFAFGVVLVTTLLFGLAPAWRATDIRPMHAMKNGQGSVATRVPRLRTARTILAFQVAMSVLVLVAAGLFVRTLANLERVNPGFDPSNVLLFRVDPGLNAYDDDRVRRLCADVLERLRAMPGVRDASFSHKALVSRGASISTIARVDGAKLQSSLMANRLIVDPHFFRTMGIPVLAGTGLPTLAGSRPGAEGVRPVVVNRTFAERAFHGRSPLGHRFQISERAGQPTYEIVGVAGDVRLVELRRDVPPTVFFSYLHEPTSTLTFAVKTRGAPEALIPAVRRAVAEVDAEVPVDRVESQEEQIASTLQRDHLFAVLASGLGLLALFLACVGIYGVMSYAVSRRTAEIGIRLALGARPSRVLLMVLGEAARVLVFGIAAGVLAAFIASTYLQSVLFGLTARDPLTQVAVVALLVVVTLLSAAVPGRRAARTDPLIALRAE